MELLFIHPVHPRYKHVAAARAREFACALARRGHRVVLLSAAMGEETLDQGDNLVSHDWSRPYVMAPAVVDQGAPPPSRSALLRRAETLIAGDGGRDKGDWAESAFGSMVGAIRAFSA